MDNQYILETETNPNVIQPIIINPVLTEGEQILTADQIAGLEGMGQINQSGNVVYLLVPPGMDQQNIIANLPAVLLMEKPDEATPQTNLQLADCIDEKIDIKENIMEDDKDLIYIRDDSSEAETDPLQILPVSKTEVSDPLTYPAQTLQTPNTVKCKTQFKCDYPGCMLTFLSIYEKKLHGDAHIFPANTEFKCNICNSMFTKADERNRHVISHSVANTYKCRMCTKTFPYYTSLVRHINEEKCNTCKLFTCSFCGVQFADEKDLETHKKASLKVCACKAKICSDQAYDLHVSFCNVYKNRYGKKEKKKSKDVIVLD